MKYSSFTSMLTRGCRTSQAWGPCRAIKACSSGSRNFTVTSFFCKWKFFCNTQTIRNYHRVFLSTVVDSDFKSWILRTKFKCIFRGRQWKWGYAHNLSWFVKTFRVWVLFGLSISIAYSNYYFSRIQYLFIACHVDTNTAVSLHLQCKKL